MNYLNTPRSYNNAKGSCPANQTPSDQAKANKFKNTSSGIQTHMNSGPQQQAAAEEQLFSRFEGRIKLLDTAVRKLEQEVSSPTPSVIEGGTLVEIKRTYIKEMDPLAQEYQNIHSEIQNNIGDKQIVNTKLSGAQEGLQLNWKQLENALEKFNAISSSPTETTKSGSEFEHRYDAQVGTRVYGFEKITADVTDTVAKTQSQVQMAPPPPQPSRSPQEHGSGIEASFHQNYSRLIERGKSEIFIHSRLSGGSDKWDERHVKMPYSPQNTINEIRGNSKVCISRWDLTTKKLIQLGTQMCMADKLDARSRSLAMKEAIGNFNKEARTANFEALGLCFESRAMEFVPIISWMTKLVNNKDISPGPVPYLRAGENKTLYMNQHQICWVLANAFFSTFPQRGKSHASEPYPPINFTRLFEGTHGKMESKAEKLKCIFNYFNEMRQRGGREASNASMLSFSRRHLPEPETPNWFGSLKQLSKAQAFPKGKIEEQSNMLQVDFANKFVGGGILGNGAVMEEILFSMCPELIAACLFTEKLGDRDVLVVNGAEKFSKYSGYGHSFKYQGPFTDNTGKDELSRRKTEIVAMDALQFNEDNSSDQFKEKCIRRELNKAYCGFKVLGWSHGPPSPIASGNWGCGALNGDPELKFLIQLMAATEAGRELCMFTFGDHRQANDINQIMAHLHHHRFTLGSLYTLVVKYYKDEVQGSRRHTPVKSMFRYVFDSRGAGSTN